MVAGILIVALFCTGLWGILAKRNLIKKVIALNILYSSIIILFIYQGSFAGLWAPILTGTATDVVDPLPQALVLTAIVIGVSITALALCLVYRIYQRYGTIDITRIERHLHDTDE